MDIEEAWNVVHEFRAGSCGRDGGCSRISYGIRTAAGGFCKKEDHFQTLEVIGDSRKGADRHADFR